MKHGFQPGQSKGLSARYHFRFTGSQPGECTITIRDEKTLVQEFIDGDCDLRVTANSMAWLRLLRKEASAAWLISTFQIRLPEIHGFS